VNHIFFKCVNSKFIWAVLKEAFGWHRYPVSLEDFLANWMGGEGSIFKNRMRWFWLGVVGWVLFITKFGKAGKTRLSGLPNRSIWFWQFSKSNRGRS
jgi:hypothetical protein